MSVVCARSRRAEKMASDTITFNYLHINTWGSAHVSKLPAGRAGVCTHIYIYIRIVRVFGAVPPPRSAGELIMLID